MKQPTHDQAILALRIIANDYSDLYPWLDDDGDLRLIINVNDVFMPAADSEEIDWDDLPAIEEASKTTYGVYEWVAKRRNMPFRSRFQNWIDEQKERG